MDHFLVTFWIPFGTHFGTHFRTRASKTKKATFSKKWFSRGTVCIFSLLRPPKELLNPKKKGSKIDPKINKFWTNFGSQNGLQKIAPTWSRPATKMTCYKNDVKIIERLKIIILISFNTTFDTHFGTPFWDQICPRSNKMSPRGPSGASKTKKQPFHNP